jgi:FMN-dependent NADH-azoreductase
MKNILHIISSPRGDASFSTKLGNALIGKLQAEYPESRVHVHDLTRAPFDHMGQHHLEAFFTRPENRTETHIVNIRQSEKAVDELFAADIIVIIVPVFNFNIHSTLKAWIDNIVRVGRTVIFGPAGPEGLLKNKKVYLAISSRSVFSDGPMKDFDFVAPYLKYILGFLGLTDVDVVRVEGSSDPAEQTLALARALNEFEVA